MNKKYQYVLVLLLGVVLGIFINQYINYKVSVLRAAERDALYQEILSTPDPTKIYVKVSQFVSPSVVNIRVDTAEYTTDWLFEEIIRSERTSLGSGILIDKDGHIVTNYHVVKDHLRTNYPDEKGIKVIFSNRNLSYNAKVIGFDQVSDIAVLKIDKSDIKDLQPAILGDSDKVEVGQGVLLVGNPFALGHTVSAGIISYKERQGGSEIQFAENPYFRGKLIQIDAAVNKGYSGGALVDLKGNVIGVIVGAVFSGYSQATAGIGFAIPINTVKRVASQIIKEGKVKRGFLGVYRVDIDGFLLDILAKRYGMIFDSPSDLLKYLKLDKPEGSFILKVIPGSAAEKAGLQEGDIIIKVDNEKVTNSSELSNIIESKSPGERIKISVIRNGKIKELEAVLDEAGKKVR